MYAQMKWLIVGTGVAAGLALGAVGPLAPMPARAQADLSACAPVGLDRAELEDAIAAELAQPTDDGLGGFEGLDVRVDPSPLPDSRGLRLRVAGTTTIDGWADPQVTLDSIPGVELQGQADRQPSVLFSRFEAAVEFPAWSRVAPPVVSTGVNQELSDRVRGALRGGIQQSLGAAVQSAALASPPPFAGPATLASTPHGSDVQFLLCPS